MCINYFWSKGKIPKKIPVSMEKEVKRLSKTKSKLECLKKAYKIIDKNFYGKSINFFLKFPRVFISDVSKLWDYRFGVGDGYLHCNQLNFLLRTLLIKSGKFKDKDIILVDHIRKIIGIHQYLIVKINSKSITIDVYFSRLGTPFGKRVGSWFKLKTIV